MNYYSGFQDAIKNFLKKQAAKVRNKIIRGAINIVASVLAGLLPLLIPTLLVVGFIYVFFNVGKLVSFSRYDLYLPSVSIEDVVNTTITDIYYNKFAEQSLYVVIDGIEEEDEYSGRSYKEFDGHIDSRYLKKLLQSGSDVYKSLKLEDPDNYEERLMLSRNTLAMLDKDIFGLVGERSLSNVLSFIKPVYATCTRDDDFENFSECVLLNLLPVDENGEYVDITEENSSQSALEGLRNWKEERDEWIEEHQNKNATVTEEVNEEEKMPIPEQNRTGAFSIKYNPELPESLESSETDVIDDNSAIIWNKDGENKTLSVSDWGLGSIAHFQAKYEPSKISNYKFKSIKVLDPNWEYGQEGAVVDVLGEHNIERYNDQTMSDNKIEVEEDLNWKSKVGESIGLENVFKDYNVHNQDEGVITGYQEGDEHAYYWVANEIIYKTNKLADPNYSMDQAPEIDNPLGTGYWRYEPYFVIPNTTLGYIIDYAVTPFGTIKFAVSQGWATLEEVFHDQTVSKFKEFDIDIGDSNVDDQEDADEYKKITLNGFYDDGNGQNGTSASFVFYIDGDATPVWTDGQVLHHHVDPSYKVEELGPDDDTSQCLEVTMSDGKLLCTVQESNGEDWDYCAKRGRWDFVSTLDKDSKLQTSESITVYADESSGSAEGRLDVGDNTCTIGEPSYTVNPAYVFTLNARVQGYRKIKQTKHVDGYISSDQEDVYRYYTDYFERFEAYVPYSDNEGYVCSTLTGEEPMTVGSISDCGNMPDATSAKSANHITFEGPNETYLAGMPWPQKKDIANDLGFNVETEMEGINTTSLDISEVEVDDVDYLSYIGDDLDKYREWKSEFTKQEHYKETIGHWFDEYSGQYGVPKDLLMTIYYIEQFNDDKENVMDVPEGTYTTWNFIYGIQDEGVNRDTFVGKLEEFNTNHPEAHMADESKIHDQPDRIAIKAAAMYLSNLNVKYKGNVPMVIQAYGYHDEAFEASDVHPGDKMQSILDNYHNYGGIPDYIAIQETENISWYHFLDVKHERSSAYNMMESFNEDEFLIYVFQNMPTAKYDFTMPVLETSFFTSPSLTAKETTTLNRFNLTDRWQEDDVLSTALKVALYKVRRDEAYENVWNKIVSDSIYYKDGYFVDDEGSVDTTLYLPEKAIRVYPESAYIDTLGYVNGIIKESCGIDIDANVNRSKETLQRCFSNAMGNEQSQLNSTLNIKDIFGTNWIGFPVKKYSIIPNDSAEDIGTKIKIKEFKDDDGLNPIMNMYKSKVINISTLPDGTYDVLTEIDAEHSTYEYVYVEYYGLKNIEVSEDQELETGEYIGIAETDDVFTMYLEMDGHMYDMAEVFRTLEARKFGLGGIYGDFTPDFENPVWQDNPYPVGQCTWFAYGLVAQVYGVELRNCGNGENFASCAINDYGWVDSGGPQPGALCSVSATAGRPYGHVLIVLDVMGDRMTVIHGNFQGKDDYSWEDATEENIGWQVTEISSSEFTYGNHTKGSYTCALPSTY